MDEGPAHDLPEGRPAFLHADVQGQPARIRVPALADAEVRVGVVALGRIGALANDVADIQILGQRVGATQVDDWTPAR